MFDDWDNFLFNGYGDATMALAYILDKYDTGIALTKMENGEFKKINVNETTTNGTTTYTQSNCP